jgi:hypothetical protein
MTLIEAVRAYLETAVPGASRQDVAIARAELVIALIEAQLDLPQGGASGERAR